MSTNGSQDESGDRKSSAACPSKAGSEEGRWYPLTLEKLPALTAVFASWSLVVSVVYDWGFFSALGISFAHAPTTLSDHLSSWLVWATLYSPIPLAYVIYMLIRLRKYASVALGEERDDEIPSDFKLPFRRMRLTYRIIFWVFPALCLSWLLVGTPENPWGWLSVSWIALVGLITVPSLPNKVTASARFLVRSTNFPILLLTFVPATCFAFFGIGYGYPDRAQDDTMPKAYVRLQAGDSDAGPVVEQTYILRSFANWLLVQDHDGTQVDWVRIELVDRIEVPPDDRFPGLFCGIFGVLCSGDPGMNLTSSLPNGTHGNTQARYSRDTRPRR